MKLLRWIAPLWALVQAATAGQSTLTETYQPLVGHAKFDIVVAEVTCHHWYANSASHSVNLIAARNVPPTDVPEQANKDLNLASICSLKFRMSYLGGGEAPLVTLDATGFAMPEHFKAGSPEGELKFRDRIVRASFECLRLCLKGRPEKTPVTLKCKDADKEWLGKIVAEYNKHDHTKAFFKSSPWE